MNNTTDTIKEFSYKELTASIETFKENYAQDISKDLYFGFPMEAVLDAENRLLSPKKDSVAYFSMEFGLAPSIYNSFRLSRPMSEMNQFFSHEVFSNIWLCDYLFKVRTDKMLDIPIYGGGLGVLAGDTIKSAADLKTSFAGIGILWNKGYFKQNFWYKHGQVPEELKWDPYTYPGLIPLNHIVTIDTKEGPLHLRLWKYYIYSYNKKTACPLILLDSNLEQNVEHFRRLTDQLYRSDTPWWKIFQRVILGIGGMKALEALGYQIKIYHLNEGHAAFSVLEDFSQSGHDAKQANGSKDNFVFTCHTPVEAGHDRFSVTDLNRVLGQNYIALAQSVGLDPKQTDLVNLTYISLNSCSKVNAVALKHGEVMRVQFPKYASKIDAITNGVHTHTWLTESFANLFDKYRKVLGDWRETPENLEKVSELQENVEFRRDIFNAHMDNKRNLVSLLRQWRMDENLFTMGWARRIASYKRPALIFHDIDAIVNMAKEIGPIQFVMAGKAHPNDNIGGAQIDLILDHIDRLNKHQDIIRVLILENYDTYFGKLLTSSVDVWLNNPIPPFEASGTSGMKAILNGVLQLSTLDGWVVEAENDNIGWIFGYQHPGGDIGKETDLHMEEDSRALTDKLKEVVGLYYETLKDEQLNVSSPWVDKMINCVRRSGFFNTHRMVQQYQEKMWRF